MEDVNVDTDALIAVANTRLWSRLPTTLKPTTTNVCYQELTRHNESIITGPDGLPDS